HFTFINCRTDEIRLIPADLKDHDLLLVDTGVSHNLADSEYNDRRASCEAVLDKARLYREVRDVSDLRAEDLEYIGNRHPEVSTREVEYVLQENQRVLDAVVSLRKGRISEVGQLMYSSHAVLRDQYGVSCPELDFLVELGQAFGVTGARMMGGGFGGSTINLLRGSSTEEFIRYISEHYTAKFGLVPQFRQVSPARGAAILERE